MKKINLVTSILVCTAVLSPSVLSANAVDEIIITPDLYANFKVVDSNGNYLDDASMELIDSDGNIVASWTGNNSNTLTSSYKAGNLFTQSIDDMIDVPDIEDEVITSFKFGYNNGYANSLGEYDFGYGVDYSATINYVDNNEVALTVPANKMLINVDSAIANRTKKIGIGIGGDIMDYELYYFNDIAGQEVLYDMEAGTHNAYTCIGGSAGSGGSVTISEQPTTYIEATVNLHEVAPNYFNADGTTDKNFFGTDHNFNYGVDTDDTSAVLYIISGAVVNAVVPDENSNVTIYIDQSTYEYEFSTTFSSSTGSGGGINGGTVDYSKDYSFNVSAVELPDEGINLVNLEPGEYTLRQTNTLDGYEKPDDITVVLENSSDIQQVEMVNEQGVVTTTSVTTTSTSTSTSTSTTNAVSSDTETSSTNTSASTSKNVTTTTAATTKKATSTTTKTASNSPKTGVNGMNAVTSAFAVAGVLAIASRSKKK